MLNLKIFQTTSYYCHTYWQHICAYSHFDDYFLLFLGIGKSRKGYVV